MIPLNIFLRKIILLLINNLIEKFKKHYKIWDFKVKNDPKLHAFPLSHIERFRSGERVYIYTLLEKCTFTIINMYFHYREMC